MRKNILITGASSGLGRGMAREFAKQGANLALCARRSERLEELKQELENQHPDIRVLVKSLDVNDYDQVFTIFRAFQKEMGSLDRIIVNAGIGKGQPLGTGYFYANRQTAETNFVAALAQCEAALDIFREQNDGHLVTISSFSAVRGMPRNLTTYAASKAGLLHLTEGIEADLINSPIKVSCILPGFIRSEINEKVPNTPFIVGTEKGCQLMVKAINKEKSQAIVPGWPWKLMWPLLKVLPISITRKFS